MIRSGETTTALTPFPIAPGTNTAYSASEPKHWTKGFRNELLAPLPSDQYDEEFETVPLPSLDLGWLLTQLIAIHFKAISPGPDRP